MSPTEAEAADVRHPPSPQRPLRFAPSHRTMGCRVLSLQMFECPLDAEWVMGHMDGKARHTADNPRHTLLAGQQS